MSSLPAAPPTNDGGALQTAIAFARALRDGDPIAALEYFGDGARLLTADGTEVSGPEAIGGVLSRLIGSCRRLEIGPGRTIVAGRVALCTQSWRLVTVGGGEAGFMRGTNATLVLHQIGQRWRIVVAAPWG